MTCTFDTNILVYTLPDPTNTKHHQARNLLIRGARPQAGILLLQSLTEFSHVAARKFGLSINSIRRRVHDWSDAIPVRAAGQEDLMAALTLARDHRIGFWDAMLCATADRAGLQYLLSEDMQDGRQLGSLRIINPFRPENAALIDRILPP
jgi:predicted nucleic acid-binding protein